MYASSTMTARRPLFDRLIDDDLQEKEEKTIKDRLDIEGLKDSIARELKMILNTRSPSRSKSAVKGKYLLPSDFGLKDYSHLSPSGSNGLIIRNFINAIQAYEPRLLKPEVRVVRYDRISQKMYVEIQGVIKLGQRVERFSFPLDLDIE